jgi:hypothetical protein
MARRRKKGPTEAGWLACEDPEEMLEMVKDRVSVRKMRLVGVACCRRISHLFHAKACHRGVEVAERFADGLATAEERLAAYCAVGKLKERGHVLFAHATLWRNRTACMSALSVYEALMPDDALLLDGGGTATYRAAGAAFDGAYEAVGTRDEAAPDAGLAASEAEVAAQVRLVRDVMGNPFRPVRVNPEWLARDGGLVPRLARGIYEERAFERMPVLADALEEAGCDDPEMLAHAREQGDHVRGCWLLDALLGKA